MPATSLVISNRLEKNFKKFSKKLYPDRFGDLPGGNKNLER